MEKNNSPILVIVLLLVCANSLWPQTKKMLAFPGAEGFGRFAKGGRGGDVYHVTNLNDAGKGSLRYGIKKAKGPCTIVFDISGNIKLTKPLTINKSHITIAGQTAPGDGITITGYPLITDADDLIIRYIRCRLGDDHRSKYDAIHVSSGSNIIFDHVTASWSTDETFSFQSKEIDSLTVQWCMITESLRDSYHEKGPHGYGGIIGGKRQTIHHNLYAHHSSRSPKVTGRRHCEVDFKNNVIYNWGYNNCYDGTSSYMNWVNNYYKSGPGTKKKVRNRIFQLSDEDIEPASINSPQDSQNYETSLYAEGNYVEGFPVTTKDNWNGGISFTGGATMERNRAHKPFDFPTINEQTAQEAYQIVVSNAGASLSRDTIDKRIINEVLTGTAKYGNGGIIDSQDDVGGLPDLKSLPAPKDSDQDGMADDWEMEYGLNPDDPEDRNYDKDQNGYTNLEEYLNWLVDHPISNR